MTGFVMSFTADCKGCLGELHLDEGKEILLLGYIAKCSESGTSDILRNYLVSYSGNVGDICHHEVGFFNQVLSRTYGLLSRAHFNLCK